MWQVRITKKVRLKMLSILIPLLLITLPVPFLLARATNAWVSSPDRYHSAVEVEHEGSWSGEVFKSGRDDFALVETDARSVVIPLTSEVEPGPVKFFEMRLEGSQIAPGSKATSSDGVSYSFTKISPGPVNKWGFLVASLLATAAAVSALVVVGVAISVANGVSDRNSSHVMDRPFKKAWLEGGRSPSIMDSALSLIVFGGFAVLHVIWVSTWLDGGPGNPGSFVSVLKAVCFTMLPLAVLGFTVTGLSGSVGHSLFSALSWPHPSDLSVKETQDGYVPTKTYGYDPSSEDQVSDPPVPFWVQKWVSSQKYDKGTFDVLYPGFEGTFGELVVAARELGPGLNAT